MKHRLRWYHMEARGVPLGQLRERMLADEYDDEKRSGFQIDRSSSTLTSGVFIERIDLEDVVRDPFGKELRFRRVEYRQVAFQWSSREPSFELTDPPRSCKTFFARIGSMMDHRVAIEPVQPDVNGWLRAVEAIAGRVQVQSMSFGGVALSSSVYADVVISGGQGVRGEATKLLGDKRRFLVATDIEWMHGEELVACELSRNGATYDDRADPYVTEVLRRALESTLAQK